MKDYDVKDLESITELIDNEQYEQAQARSLAIIARALLILADTVQTTHIGAFINTYDNSRSDS